MLSVFEKTMIFGFFFGGENFAGNFHQNKKKLGWAHAICLQLRA